MAVTTIGQNPFTPRSGQEPKVFLGRKKELEGFQKNLDKAKKKRYDHFVVVGGWGTGKTTLLKEFRKIAHAQNVLSSYVAVHEFPSSELLPPIVQLLTHIPRNLPIKFDRLKKFSKYLQGVGITLPVIGGGIEISEKKRFDGDPQVLLLDGLLQLWQELKEETDALVVCLDDVQNYESVKQILGILKNVLSDEDIIKKTGYLFALAATDEGWSGFLRKNDPIGRYFIPIVRVQNFSAENTRRIVDATLKDTGVTFTSDVKDTVYEYTEGHPFQMQVFCMYLYENQIKGRVSGEQVDAALTQTLDELGTIVLDPLYAQASEQEKDMLALLSTSYRTFGFDEILRSLKKHNMRMEKGQLATMLSRLSEKGLLVKLERGKYRVISRLFNEFLVRQ
jgi:hypothetical protein